jgi:DNA polymerase III sliding clamp (beta) subunit (PCNA family)
MQQIQKYCSKSDIKPELALVYVHEDPTDGTKYAVATDSFRLARERLPDLLQEHMPTGYYQPKAYKEIVQAYNKSKRNIKTIVDTIISQTALQSQYSSYTYPDYTRVIPDTNTLAPFSGTLTLHQSYFLEFIELIPTSRFEALDFTDIKQKDSTMLVYTNETLTLLLMSQNK